MSSSSSARREIRSGLRPSRLPLRNGTTAKENQRTRLSDKLTHSRINDKRLSYLVKFQPVHLLKFQTAPSMKRKHLRFYAHTETHQAPHKPVVRENYMVQSAQIKLPKEACGLHINAHRYIRRLYRAGPYLFQPCRRQPMHRSKRKCTWQSICPRQSIAQ